MNTTIKNLALAIILLAISQIFLVIADILEGAEPKKVTVTQLVEK